ncbi:CHROMATIN REMODELING 8 protein [Nymphaea thermarum]|nr:CHROMATIN REMODELING 8 protein [Nymphaea thermarum]
MMFLSDILVVNLIVSILHILNDIFQAKADTTEDGSELKEGIEGEDNDKIQDAKASSGIRAELEKRLRVLEVEIGAVAASLKQAKSFIKGKVVSSTEVGASLQGIDDDGKGVSEAARSNSGLVLQKALATDRLRSLRKTRDQLNDEITVLENDASVNCLEDDKILHKLVKENNQKTKSKVSHSQNKETTKRKTKKIVSYNEDVDFDAVLDAASAGFVETERDKLIRKGVLTPFYKLEGFERRLQQPGPSDRSDIPEDAVDNDHSATAIAKFVSSVSAIAQARPATKLLNAESLPKLDPPTHPFRRLQKRADVGGKSGGDMHEKPQQSGIRKRKRPVPDKRWRKVISCEDRPFEADGEMNERATSDDSDTGGLENEPLDAEEPEDTTEDGQAAVTLEGGLRIPESIFGRLFDYQKVGVQWLWELHCQRAGGIIGDEMGLGKTIQVISFLAALHFSKMYKPSIILCPLTLLRQWRREIRSWYPYFHVEILHDSAQDSVDRQQKTCSSESDDENEASSDNDHEQTPKTNKGWDLLIDRVVQSESGLLITTYEQLRLHGEKLLDIEWGYAVLDEGHRIRNPNAEITLVCKQLQTVHRIIMTGAPIQNKLTELWSLFDFVFPGKLGVLPVFEAQFAVPISIGGYANATPLQVSTAYRCAVVLRDLIMPYLLRRMKADVDAQLPKKTEHVLFCSLSAVQRSMYRAFLASSEVEQILDGNRNSLYGIDVMRKICNHPDLLEREHSASHPDYGNPERSGKMNVISQVLKLWRDQNHRVLLFTQTQQMLDILENFLTAKGYVYRRMDGLTPVRQRMALIDEFNNSSDVFIFILTTKVGGLGTNLTGANRVIIFDPDWNPSTDMQARERAWRIGQTRDVTIYRLITRGTIEEKIYHRQIYKHFLTNKILKNPQQRRFFKARDMKDLFTLKDDEDSTSTETSNIFSQLSSNVNVDVRKNGMDGMEPPIASTGKNKKTGKGRVHEARVNANDPARDGQPDEGSSMLESLLDVHGLHSAMNHDVIMNANDEEKLRLQEEASQVAQRAAEALRQSRAFRSQDSISIPTWTGRSGAAGAPSSVRMKFGSTVNSKLVNASKLPNPSLGAGLSVGKALSSTELLARIRGAQESAIGAGLDHQLGLLEVPGSNNIVNNGRPVGSNPVASSSSCSNGDIQSEISIQQLCEFIQQKGGSTSSSTIVEHFKDKVPSKDLPLFKNLLKKIATLEKGSTGSKWILKPEYRH